MSLSVTIRGMQWKWVAGIDDVRLPAQGLFDGEGVQIIQMKNGIGKTTTLYLLRCVFTGTPPGNELYQRVRYKGRRSKPEHEKNEFRVYLNIDDEDWTVILEFSISDTECSHKFYTVVPKQGRTPGWKLPKTFRSAFEKHTSLANLFLFDTTTVGANQESLGEEAVDGAIMDLTVLRSVRELHHPTGHISDLDRVYANKIHTIAETNAAQDPSRKLTAINNVLSVLENKKTHINGLIQKYKQSLKEHDEKIQYVRQEIEKLVDQNKLKTELEVLEERLEQAKKEVENASVQLFEHLMNPANLPSGFWGIAVGYYQKLHNLRIPETMAKEWVQNIIDRGYCICGEGHELSDSQKTHLHEFKDLMVGAAVSGAVFSAKEAIIGTSCGYSTVEESRTALEKCINDQASLEHKIKLLMRRLAEDAQIKLAKFEAQLRELLEKKKKTEEELKFMTEPDTDPNPAWKTENGKYKLTPHSVYQGLFSLPDVNAALKWFRDQQAKLADVQQIKTAYELAKEIVVGVFDSTIGDLKSRLLVTSNQSLARLQSTGMRIKSFDGGMRLVDRYGMPQGGANSAGEVCAQYSFMMALREMAKIELPLVVDNPTRGLDPQALSVVSKYLPDAFQQCMYVIYPSEKELVPDGFLEDATVLTTIYDDDATQRMICSLDRAVFKSFSPPVED